MSFSDHIWRHVERRRLSCGPSHRGQRPAAPMVGCGGRACCRGRAAGPGGSAGAARGQRTEPAALRPGSPGAQVRQQPGAPPEPPGRRGRASPALRPEGGTSILCRSPLPGGEGRGHTQWHPGRWPSGPSIPPRPVGGAGGPGEARGGGGRGACSPRAGRERRAAPPRSPHRAGPRPPRRCRGRPGRGCAALPPADGAARRGDGAGVLEGVCMWSVLCC